MIRIAKLTDYGIVLMAHIARSADGGVVNARDLSETAHLPMPTVSQILKSLARGGLLVSHRGVKGGYALARHSERISVADIIGVMEGPIALTECSAHPPGQCNIESVCPVGGHWRRINDAVRRALEGLTLADMTRPMTAAFPLPLPRPRALGSARTGEGRT